MGLRFDAAVVGIPSKGQPSDKSLKMLPLLPQKKKNSRQNIAFIFIENGGLAVFQELQVNSCARKSS